MPLITSTDALAAACERLAAHPFVTVDTEFLRETTYYPKLCLIQMAGEDEVVLVDPLAPGLDLAPFYALMANTAVAKVFHAARQDVEIIWTRGRVIPAPLFDTQVAAMVCGFGEQVSYESLAAALANARIDKSSRFTDWSRRPLSEAQLTYAAADVTHLIEVYQYLKAELEREGRGHWLNEEMAILTNRETYDPHPEDAWRRLKVRLRKPIELAVVQSVAAWREREARERNVPRRRVIKDEVISEIAQQQPRDEAALGKLRTIPKGWERSAMAASLLGAINAALAIPKDELPKLPKPAQNPEGSNAAAELLKVLLRLVAEEEGVAPKVLASSDEIDRLAADGEKADVPALSGWRREVFGERALKLVRGEISLKFDKRRIVAVG